MLQVERHLEARGVGELERRRVIDVLTRTGLVDDRRFAEARASSLADRGAGDELIRHDLLEAGVGEELVLEALARLDPEFERARRIVERKGVGARTARYLAGKGFAQDVVHAAVAGPAHEALG